MIKAIMRPEMSNNQS